MKRLSGLSLSLPPLLSRSHLQVPYRRFIDFQQITVFMKGITDASINHYMLHLELEMLEQEKSEAEQETF